MKSRQPSPRRARFDALAHLVPPGSRVADIGTDQALLPRWLLLSGRASFCIATEFDLVRLARARPFPEGHPLGARLELRAGDGLDVLKPSDRLDVVVVAGLGAPTICRLLEGSSLERLRVGRLLLQPASEPARVRRWLVAHGFPIVDERLVMARSRFFTVLAAEPGDGRDALPDAPPLSREDLLEAGPCLIRSGNPLVALYWREELGRQEEILRRAGGGSGRGREAARRRREVALRILEVLNRSGPPRRIGEAPP